MCSWGGDHPEGGGVVQAHSERGGTQPPGVTTSLLTCPDSLVSERAVSCPLCAFQRGGGVSTCHLESWVNECLNRG
jgi:hypothetical protein